MRTIPSVVFVFLAGASCVFGQDRQPSLDELIAIVNGTDSIKGAEAIAAIGKRKPASDRAIQILLDSLSDERRAEYIPAYFPVAPRTVGAAASDALAEVGQPAVSPICDFLGDRPGKTVLRLAIRSLSKMEHEAVDAIPTLQALLSDPETTIRHEVVAALVSIQKDPRALSSALEPVFSDESPDVRAAAIRALGNLGEAGSQSIPGIVKLLDDTDERQHFLTPDFTGTRPVRYDSVLALAEMGQDARVALAKLHEMMNGDPDRLVRIASAYAIAKLDNTSNDALDYLIESVRDRENGWGGAQREC